MKLEVARRCGATNRRYAAYGVLYDVLPVGVSLCLQGVREYQGVGGVRESVSTPTAQTFILAWLSS